jgi:protein-tyrosine phosphatase
MIKILFVCLGNICRSPLAEAIFNSKLERLSLQDKFIVDSAGTADYHIGENPDARTIKVAKLNNLQIIHKARQITTMDFSEFDYILAMDRSNLENIETLQDGSNNIKILLIREFDKKKELDVPDPYYGGKDGFKIVYSILDSAIENFLQFLRKKHNL